MNAADRKILDLAWAIVNRAGLSHVDIALVTMELEAFVASETAEKEAARLRCDTAERKLIDVAIELKAAEAELDTYRSAHKSAEKDYLDADDRADLMEAERDRLTELQADAFENQRQQIEALKSDLKAETAAKEAAERQADSFDQLNDALLDQAAAAEAERDRAVRALEFLKSYNRGIYDCAIRFAEEPVPVPAPTKERSGEKLQ